jgi:hypothetical protein
MCYDVRMLNAYLDIESRRSIDSGVTSPDEVWPNTQTRVLLKTTDTTLRSMDATGMLLSL